MVQKGHKEYKVSSATARWVESLEKIYALSDEVSLIASDQYGAEAEKEVLEAFTAVTDVVLKYTGDCIVNNLCTVYNTTLEQPEI